MASVVEPSNYFLNMRTMGNLMTVSLRRGAFYVRRKSKPSDRSPLADENVLHTYFAKLAEFQGMTTEQRASLDAAALQYYTDAFTLLLSLGFKAYMSSILGTCQLGAAMCGGNVR